MPLFLGQTIPVLLEEEGQDHHIKNQGTSWLHINGPGKLMLNHLLFQALFVVAGRTFST
jgi:hypothetical protein